MRVYIQQGKDEIDTAIKILKKAKPNIEDKVLIKPNLTMPYSPKSNICTSPKIVEGIIKYLRDNGIRDIVIGEGAGGAKNMDRYFEVTGYKELSARLKVPLINLNQDEIIELKVNNCYFLKRIPIAKTVLDRYVINVPKLKTHRMAMVSFAMKNMMGSILPYNKKSILHPLYEKLVKRAIEKKRVLTDKEFKDVQEEFFKRLIDFYSVYKPSLNIIDAFVGRDGDGLTLDCGKNIRMNCILLSKDIIAIDYVASHLMGFNLSDLYLKYIKDKKINKLSDIDIISNKDLSKLRKKFRPTLLTEKIVF